MKKIMYIIGIIPLLILAACHFMDNGSGSNEVINTTAIETLSKDYMKKIGEQDSLMKELVLKVDELTSELNDLKANVSKLSKDINDIKSPKSTLSWFFLILFVFLVIITFIIKRNIEKKIKNIDCKCDDNLDLVNSIEKKISNLNGLALSKKNNTKQPIFNNQSKGEFIDELKPIIRQIVMNIFDENKGNSDLLLKQTTTKKEDINDYARIGYAELNKDIYFTRILNSQQEGCVFKIEFLNPDEGRFTILSLDKIKSLNGWEKVIEYTGTYIDEARSFNVDDYGVCKRVNDNYWEVKNKLKITLS